MGKEKNNNTNTHKNQKINNKKSDQKIVSSLSEFMQQISTLTKEDSYIFRGQSNEKWLVQSGHHRLKESDNKNDITYSQEILKNAGKHVQDLKSTLESLTRLQHFGAETVLIDFTKNALIALFFACNTSMDANGKVFCLSMTKKDHKDLNEKEEDIETALNLIDNQNFAIYEPPYKNNTRALHQKSVLLYKDKNTPLRYEEIVISKDNKKSILKGLKDGMNISPITLFPDLQGFVTHYKLPMDESDSAPPV